MIEAGRVFGSKYSMRWSRSSFFRPVPARYMAVVGVVGTLMIDGFAAPRRGLEAGSPGGYCVTWSNGDADSPRTIATARAATIPPPPPSATTRRAATGRPHRDYQPVGKTK